MKDFIKDLNIIDSLGILLPGSLLILLFSSAADGWALWNAYFGADCSEATKAVFLLVAGYVLGMLIHEIGDIAENGLWLLLFFDPKVYAARAVGATRLYSVLERKHLLCKVGEKAHEEGEEAHGKTEERSAAKGKMLQTLKFCLGCTQPRTWHTKAGGRILFFVGASFSFVAFTGTLFLGGLPWLMFIFFLIISSLLARGPIGGLLHSSLETLEVLCAIRLANPAVQAALAAQSNDQKRTLFNGFHAMARNFWFACGITGVLQGLFSPFQLPPFMLALWFRICFCIFLILLLVRCWHYAYLNYKYSFEDYLTAFDTEP